MAGAAAARDGCGRASLGSETGRDRLGEAALMVGVVLAPGSVLAWIGFAQARSLELGRVVLAPGSVLAWIVIGLVAGALAARLVRGRGLGCLMDLVVGVLGALVGGFLLSLLGPGAPALGFLGTLVVATLGAVLLLTLLRLLQR